MWDEYGVAMQRHVGARRHPVYARDGRMYRVADDGRHAHALDDASVEARTEAIRGSAVPSGWPPLPLHRVSGGPRRSMSPRLSAGHAENHGRRRRGRLRGGPSVLLAGHGLFARPFDAERLEFSGAEVQVTTEAASFRCPTTAPSPIAPGVSVSQTDVVRPQRPPHGTLGEPGRIFSGAVAARPPCNGRAGRCSGTGDLWDVDLASGIFSRLTSDPAV